MALHLFLSKTLVAVALYATALLTAASAGCGHSGKAGIDREVTDGLEVFLLQESLVALGYLKPESVDGDIGPTTRSALNMFQTDAGLNATGRAGPDTLLRIYEVGKQKSVNVLFAPDPKADHDWPDFSAKVVTDEGGKCDLVLEGDNCPEDSIRVRFPAQASWVGYKNTTCRLTPDEAGQPIYQHIGNEFVFVWLQSSGYRFPENTRLIGVTQSCDAVFVPDQPGIAEWGRTREHLLENAADYAPVGVGGTKEMHAQYEDILEQAGRMDLLREVHPENSYRLTAFHPWNDESCD